MLVVVTILLRRASSPKRWIDFCHDRPTRRHKPAIERPELNGGHVKADIGGIPNLEASRVPIELTTCISLLYA
jgi:hypothetical protein